MSEFTVILRRIQQSDAKVAEELLPLLYRELRGLAARKMAGERSSQPLQPIAVPTAKQ